MAVLAIEQTPAGRLIEVLEPVHADNRRLIQRRLDEAGIGRRPALFLGHFHRPRPERATVTGAELELGDQHRFVQRLELVEVVTVLRLGRVEVEADDVAVLGTGGDCFRSTHGITATQQQVVGRMPFQ
ncbi:hypothetical protein D3C80_1659770 [compost metagenome]